MANIALTTAARVEVVKAIEMLPPLIAAEAIVAGAPIRLDTGSGKATNANATSAAEARVIGIATRSAAAGEAITGMKTGILDGFAFGSDAYDLALWLSDTDGRVGNTAGTVNVSLGRIVPGNAQTLGTASDKLFYVDIQHAEVATVDNLESLGTLTVAGAATLNGAVTLGNAAGDAITVTGTMTAAELATFGALTATGNVALGNNAAADTLTITADTTVATGGAVAITDADVLTVGGVIVPQEMVLSIPIGLHATKTEYNLFVARDAWQVVHMDYTPDIAQGGALTATIVKAVGTATPANGTTPMHTANAIDLNGTAHTVQPITNTATGADLVLAAGNRIGLDLSGAMTVGSGLVTIHMKRV